MRTADKIIGGVLILFSVVALLSGIVTIVHAHGSVKARFSALNNAVVADLKMAEESVALLKGRQEVTAALIAPSASAATFAEGLPTSLETMTKTLEQTAYTVDATADTMRAMGQHTGLVLPGEEFAKNAVALESEAASLRELAAATRESQQQASAVAADLREASDALEQIRSDISESDLTVERLEKRLRITREAVEKVSLGTQVAKQVTLQGLVFILLSVVLAALAGLWLRLSRQFSS